MLVSIKTIGTAPVGRRTKGYRLILIGSSSGKSLGWSMDYPTIYSSRKKAESVAKHARLNYAVVRVVR